MKKLLFALCLCVTLAACDSADERAEKHYQAALALIHEGDALRGLLELRNVFQLNGRHREARRLYANTVLTMGRVEEAYSQYLRLVEQYPDDLEANRILARLSVQIGQTVEARRFLDVVLAAEPDNLELQSIDTLITYEISGNSDRIMERNAALERASALLEQDPSLKFARQVLLAHLLRERDWNALLAQLDLGLEYDPRNIGLFRLRLVALEQLGATDEIEETLLTMTSRFPDNAEIGTILVRWYIGNNRLAEAEDWLRNQIDPDSDSPQARLTLIDFLSNLRGLEVAFDELNRIQNLSPQPRDIAANFGVFTSLQAGLMFEIGDKQRAIALLEELLKDTDLGKDAEETDRIKVALAQMYERSNNTAGARALVEEVLLRDASQVGALKMRANWEIDADNTDQAIATLREALDQAPNDANVLTMLARAYEREGSKELMLEMLVLAVEAANRAPQESLYLADTLMQDGQLRSAENVLIESLRANPYHVALLQKLGKLHIEMADWGRVAQDIKTLRGLATREANTAADTLESERLLRENRTDDLIRFVEGRAAEDKTGEAGVIRALVLTGRTDEALQRAEAFYAAQPEDLIARFVYASVLTYTEDDEKALPIFEELVAADPTMSGAWSSIYTIHYRAGDMEAALAALDKAERSKPKDLNLRWIRAGHFESIGDPETAIAIYEDAYALNSSQPVIANNLASLLSTTREDAESLERAYIVSRRLRDTDVPAFADTYGWIAFRRNDLEDALRHLEFAVKGLPNDASVHYHMGRTYMALERYQDATAMLERAKLLIDEGGKAYPGLSEQVAQALADMPVAQPDPLHEEG